MAREALARLYDVDKNSIVYTKPDVRGKYDHGTIAFRAKDGKLVDLDKMHESVWATRLSGGTRSALVHLEVTVAGDVSDEEGDMTLTVPATNAVFQLAKSAEAEDATKLDLLQAALARGDRIVSVTGLLEGWTGHWPKFLNQPPPQVKRLLVTGFEIASTSK